MSTGSTRRHCFDRQQPSTVNSPALPAITCLCPTYGRFERLRDAVACFLLQDYAGEKRLLILNDAPEPLRLASDIAVAVPITILNSRLRYPTLGHKRQALLLMARTPLVAHWDDDDLYLPWHLSACVAALFAVRRTHPWARCAKPDAAWYGKGPRDTWQLAGVRHNTFEGQMVFDRARALELGGYPPLDSGQAAALLDAFRRAGELHTWDPPRHDLSYIYRWADGLTHVSGAGCGSVPASGTWDFGLDADGHAQPLLPPGHLAAGSLDAQANGAKTGGKLTPSPMANRTGLSRQWR